MSNRRPWSRKKILTVGIAVTVALIAAISFGVISLIGKNGDPVVSAATPQPVVSATEDWKAAEERARAQQWVSNKLPAYACGGKTEQADFTRWSDVVLCPDYTVTIHLKGREASDVPVVISADNGMITVTPVHYTEKVKNSDTHGVTIQVQGWIFKITYASSVIPAGINEKFDYKIGGIESYWTGPSDYGVYRTSETFSDSTQIVEIYGASKDLAVIGNPIDLVKDPNRS